MANPALSAHELAKPEPHKRTRARADRQQAAADKLVYELVNERDGLRCRACGTCAGIDAHRHHLLGRRYTATACVVIICEECHGFLHVRVGGILMKLYGDADQRNAHGALCGLTLGTRQNDGSWRVETNL